MSWSSKCVIFGTGNSGANHAWRILSGVSEFDSFNFAGFLSVVDVDKILFATWLRGKFRFNCATNILNDFLLKFCLQINGVFVLLKDFIKLSFYGVL